MEATGYRLPVGIPEFNDKKFLRLLIIMSSSLERSRTLTKIRQVTIAAVLLMITALALACSSSSQAQKTKLTVACDATWPPFEIVNEQTKQVDGFGPELIRAIAEKAGLDIEFVNAGFDSVLAGDIPVPV